MANDSVIDFVNEERERGASEEEIKDALLGASWPDDEAEAFLRSVASPSELYEEEKEPELEPEPEPEPVVVQPAQQNVAIPKATDSLVEHVVLFVLQLLLAILLALIIFNALRVLVS